MCRNNYLKVVDTILNHDSIDINKARTDNGETPFLMACQKGHLDIANALLNHKSIEINKASDR